MPLTLEQGAGLPDADSYVDRGTVAAYAAARNLAWAPADDDAADAACRVGTSFVDGAYRARWPGWRLNRRAQALEWPRSSAMTASGDAIGPNEVPREVIAAACEAAVREAASPGSLSPDVDAGGAAITSVKADTVSVDFGGAGFTGQSVFTAIDMVLAPILATADPYSARAGRC